MDINKQMRLMQLAPKLAVGLALVSGIWLVTSFFVPWSGLLMTLSVYLAAFVLIFVCALAAFVLYKINKMKKEMKEMIDGDLFGNLEGLMTTLNALGGQDFMKGDSNNPRNPLLDAPKVSQADLEQMAEFFNKMGNPNITNNQFAAPEQKALPDVEVEIVRDDDDESLDNPASAN